MKRNDPEQQIQKAVCQHLDWYGVPGLVWFPVPNGGKRGRTEAARMKGWGCKAGVPDLILAANGYGYALELKAPSGKLSKEQTKFLLAMDAAGWKVNCAYGIDEALNVLTSWGLLRTQRQAA